MLNGSCKMGGQQMNTERPIKNATKLHIYGRTVGNKGEIIPKFSLKITRFDFTKKM